MSDTEFSSSSPEHITPSWLIATIKSVLGEIDLDPCSTPLANQIIGAKKFYTAKQDGLDPSNPWRGSLWINPPGDKQSELVKRFWARLVLEWMAGNVTEFAWLAYNISHLRVLSGQFMSECFVAVPAARIQFLTSVGVVGTSPTRDNAILYRGPSADHFVDVMSGLGGVWVPASHWLYEQAVAL